MTNQNRVKNFAQAARHIDMAITALRKIEDDSKDLYRYDAAHFAHELSELLSCDHGQAGLLPMIEKITK